jgi:pimeloyl-ACP methyl ester carboxylesterase
MVVIGITKEADGTDASGAEERSLRVAVGIELCCRVDGDAGRPSIVLIAGLGQQLNEWPPELVDGLLREGFRVVRFDNRDVGRSSRAAIPAPTAKEMLTRRFRAAQYGLDDMALDTVGLLDGLDLDSAHLVGMSMGGMVAQTVAARHPSRVRSLVSIMSTTGAKRIGRPTLATYARLYRPVPDDREGAAKATVAMMRRIGSRGYRFDADRVRATALEAWDRDGGPNPDGPARQLAAIFKSGDRTREVGQITAPTLVIHGDRDPMVNPTGGWATSRAIPRSRLLTVPGMGHDLPAGACPEVVEAIAEHVLTAEGRREAHRG